MRIMGLDYGSKTVGVALTDPLGLTAQALETITRESESKLRRTLARLEEIVREYQVGTIVLGLPLNMDDSVGERAAKTLEFKEKLEKRLQLPVVMQDERLTTVAADEILDEMKVRRSERKKYIDKIAAAYILEDYLNSHGE
ncbi:MAG: Holliday junction resolvase RuvX [Parasporobacterium sp.]|nr:Holliday junction resolvase RuvX [Parasporobacterium sp.]